MISERLLDVKKMIQKALINSALMNHCWKTFQRNHSSSILPTLTRIEKQLSRNYQELLKKRDSLHSIEVFSEDPEEIKQQIERQIEDNKREQQTITLLKTNHWSLSQKYQEMYDEYTSYYNLEKEDMRILAEDHHAFINFQEMMKLKQRIQTPIKKEKKIPTREKKLKKQEDPASEEYVAKTKIIHKSKINTQTRSRKRESDSVNNCLS